SVVVGRDRAVVVDVVLTLVAVAIVVVDSVVGGAALVSPPPTTATATPPTASTATLATTAIQRLRVIGILMRLLSSRGPRPPPPPVNGHTWAGVKTISAVSGHRHRGRDGAGSGRALRRSARPGCGARGGDRTRTPSRGDPFKGPVSACSTTRAAAP